MQRVQRPYDLLDVVFLKEADGGDARGSRLKAAAGVRERDSTQGQDRDRCLAGLSELPEARGAGVLLFEDRGQDGEGRALGGGLGYF